MSDRGSAGEQQAGPKASVLLLGDGPTAPSALRSLLAACTVLGVLRSATQPVDEQLEADAGAHGIPVWHFHNLHELTDHLTRLQPDSVVISSFNRILPAAVLALSRFINVHYSPLPRYRGRANVNWAIINGEPTAAISIHLVNPGLDDGNILYQEHIAIDQRATAQSLYQTLNMIQERELGRAVVAALSGQPGTAQHHEDASYGCRRLPEDGEIDWTQSSEAIDRLVRALSPPFPGAFTYWGFECLTIVRAEPVLQPPRYEGRVPGRVVGRSQAEGWVDVLTGDGVFRLFMVRTAAGVLTPAASLLRSTRTTLGLSRQTLLSQIAKLETRIGTLEAAMHNPDLVRSKMQS